jgi:hypothetical protein
MKFQHWVFHDNKDQKPEEYIMENLSNGKKSDILPEFQAFLLATKLAQEKNVLLYALWASKYFTYSRKKQINSDIYHEYIVIEFVESLKSDANISEWQVRQAHTKVGSKLIC